jgi:hypothetical protein
VNLHDLLASPTAFRMGFTLLHSLWEVAAVGAVLWVTLALLRRRSPQVRYVAAAAAMATILALTAATFQVIEPPAKPEPLAAAPAPEPHAAAPAPEPPAPVALVAAPAPPAPLAPLVPPAAGFARPTGPGLVLPALVAPMAPPPAPPVEVAARVEAPPPPPPEPWTAQVARSLEPHLPWLVGSGSPAAGVAGDRLRRAPRLAVRAPGGRRPGHRRRDGRIDAWSFH